MEHRHTKGLEITGHLDISVAENEEEINGKKETWQEVLIHGDSDGLKSLAEQLIYLAELNQEEIEEKYLPAGAREHILLRPNMELSQSSTFTIIGRLDSKKEKKFYQGYLPKDK